MTHIELVGNKGLQHLLGINEPNSNPDSVDMSTINPVVDMSMGGFLKLNDSGNYKRAYCVVENALNASSMSVAVLDYGNVAVPGFGTVAYDVGYNFRVLAWTASIYIVSGPWGATYDGRNIMMEFLLTINGSQYVQVLQGNVKIMANNFYLFFGDPGATTVSGTYGDTVVRNLVVPAGAVLSVGVACNQKAGASFDFDAAGNVRLISTLIGMQVPVGAPLPSFW